MAYSIDTRTLQPGDIFIPVKGPNFDGHDFIAEAKRKGAAQILEVDLGAYARAHRRKFNIPVIAVTGSAGKTTTKDMLAAVLGQKFKLVKSAENQNNEIGVPLTLLKIEPHHQLAIIEMAMRGPGQIAYLADLAEPTHALITNIGFTHIELLKTRDAIALAKSEVVRPSIKVFLNQRDDYYAFLKQEAEAKHAVVYTFTYAQITEANAAAVRSVAADFGLSSAEIETGLKNYQSSAHRLKVIESKTFPGVTVIDDAYNSNPDALRFALQVLREKAGRHRKIAIIGDMKELGDQAKELHRQIPVDNLELVITYGELAGNIKHTHAFAENEKKSLIEKLSSLVKSGDTVLVKGSRSMQMEEIVNTLI